MIAYIVLTISVIYAGANLIWGRLWWFAAWVVMAIFSAAGAWFGA